MLFGRKALEKELRAKTEELLAAASDALGGLSEAQQEQTGPAAAGQELEELISSFKAIKDAVEIMRQRENQLASSKQRLLEEYREFVEKSKARDDLSQGQRYQVASDFFSYLVAETAKQRTAVEAMRQDLQRLEDDLTRIETLAVSLFGPEGRALQEPTVKIPTKSAENLKQALRQLAKLVSIDVSSIGQAEARTAPEDSKPEPQS